MREFRGVRQQVYHQLRKAVAVGADVAGFIPLFEYQLHVLVGFQPHDVLFLAHQLVQFEIRMDEFERPGLDLRKVEDIADELQQQRIVAFDDRHVFLLFLLFVRRGKDARKPDDGIERRAYLVAHVGQECRFQAVRLFGTVACGEQLLLHLFAFGDHERCPDQRQRPAIAVAGFDRGLCLDPLHVPVPALVGYDAELFADLLRMPFDQVPVSCADAFPVFLVDFREVALLVHRKRGVVCQRHSGGHLGRLVEVAQDSVVRKIPLPGDDVGHVERQCEFSVHRIHLFLGVVQGRAVDAENVDRILLVRGADDDLVENIHRLVVIGEGNAPLFFQYDVDDRHELGHRLRENRRPGFARHFVQGVEGAFEVGVYIDINSVYGRPLCVDLAQDGDPPLLEDEE